MGGTQALKVCDVCGSVGHEAKWGCGVCVGLWAVRPARVLVVSVVCGLD